MVLSILAFGAIAAWDERREAAAALDDFAMEQSALAREAASALSVQLDVNSAAPGGALPRDAARVVGAVERAGAIVALVQAPGAAGLTTMSGAQIRSAPIEA